ncbi:MAG: 2-amino-4-hydroxy-6-hydroxymethyldihydropteridine diphosphokinase [Odoribacter sp.]
MQVVTILGSNLGDKREILAEAIRQLSTVGKVVKMSSLYETEPWGFETEEYFLNQVVVFDTLLLPDEFLTHCLATEQRLGRVRDKQQKGYASRPIDIDILFYDSLVLNRPNLIIPHPRLAQRHFVLAPLNEIMPDFIHPVFHQTIATLLDACTDQLKTKKIKMNE